MGTTGNFYTSGLIADAVRNRIATADNDDLRRVLGAAGDDIIRGTQLVEREWFKAIVQEKADRALSPTAKAELLHLLELIEERPLVK